METAIDGQPPEAREPSRLGAQLRAERNRLGISVREIARRVGVSPSLISQIEHDKVNPSVSTLWSLVTVLGLSMGDLFPQDGTRSRPQQSTPAQQSSGPVTSQATRAVINLESGVRWERLTATSEAPVEFLVPAGGSVMRGRLARPARRKGVRLRHPRAPRGSNRVRRVRARPGDGGLVRLFVTAPAVGDRRRAGGGDLGRGREGRRQPRSAALTVPFEDELNAEERRRDRVHR
jgi:transcriptional regulator with XRE-family HTH domain